MYGLQIRNDEEVSEISEYVGNLSGFDGQNFNPVVTTEPLSGYGLSLNNEKIILHNDDTFKLRHIISTSNHTWSHLFTHFRYKTETSEKLVGRFNGQEMHVYALDRVSISDKKGHYGVQLDSQIFAPIQKPVSINTVELIKSTKVNKYPSGSSDHIYQVSLSLMFNADLNQKFIDFGDLKRIVFGSQPSGASIDYVDCLVRTTENYQGQYKIFSYVIRIAYRSDDPRLPAVDTTIHEYVGIR